MLKSEAQSCTQSEFEGTKSCTPQKFIHYVTPKKGESYREKRYYLVPKGRERKSTILSQRERKENTTLHPEREKAQSYIKNGTDEYTRGIDIAKVTESILHDGQSRVGINEQANGRSHQKKLERTEKQHVVRRSYASTNFEHMGKLICQMMDMRQRNDMR